VSTRAHRVEEATRQLVREAESWLWYMLQGSPYFGRIPKDDHPEYALMRAIAKRKKYATEKLRKAKGGKKHV
jgi:hypothetical protein